MSHNAHSVVEQPLDRNIDEYRAADTRIVRQPARKIPSKAPDVADIIVSN